MVMEKAYLDVYSMTFTQAVLFLVQAMVMATVMAMVMEDTTATGNITVMDITDTIDTMVKKEQ